MTKINSQNTRHVLAIGLLLAVGMLDAARLDAAQNDGPQTFSTPREVIQATIDAAEHNDTAALLKLFGPVGKDIVLSGDPAQDTLLRAEFVRAAREKLKIDEDRLSPNRVTFSVGTDDWPFPVPVIRKDGKWQLDSPGGRLELFARRIGRNELIAIDVCRGYAEAQMEYAASVRNGDRLLKYAQKIASTPGKQDGLFSDGAAEVLVAPAFAAASPADRSMDGRKSEPYHGYYFQVLKAQGPDAAGGAFEYVVSGKMIGGFALVAWPAEYGISGIRTLLINHEGVVYEKDLGSGTAFKARQMTKFNPDKTWRPAVLE